MFLILKSMVVTWVSFSARKSPSVNRQKRAVFPTLLSPTIIILQRFSSLLFDKYLSQIIVLLLTQFYYKLWSMQAALISCKQLSNLLISSKLIISNLLQSWHLKQYINLKQMQGGNHKIAMLHIKKQFEMIQKSESDLSISVGLVDEDLFKWRVCFQGPENSSFQGGLFEATLNFPEEYPYLPPKMAFKTQMFHPNIYPTGDVCISILHAPVEDPLNPQEKLSQKWNPILTIEAVLMSVTSMLIDPNIDSPANVDAAKLFKQNRKQYDKKQRYLARKSIGDV